MSWNTEMTVYLILLLMTGGMAFIVYAVLEFNKRMHNRINAVRDQLIGIINMGSAQPSILQGDVDIIHPKTGEKLRAKARFEVKSKK